MGAVGSIILQGHYSVKEDNNASGGTVEEL